MLNLRTAKKSEKKSEKVIALDFGNEVPAVESVVIPEIVEVLPVVEEEILEVLPVETIPEEITEPMLEIKEEILTPAPEIEKIADKVPEIEEEVKTPAPEVPKTPVVLPKVETEKQTIARLQKEVSNWKAAVKAQEMSWQEVMKNDKNTLAFFQSGNVLVILSRDISEKGVVAYPVEYFTGTTCDEKEVLETWLDGYTYFQTSCDQAMIDSGHLMIDREGNLAKFNKAEYDSMVKEEEEKEKANQKALKKAENDAKKLANEALKKAGIVVPETPKTDEEKVAELEKAVTLTQRPRKPEAISG